MPRESDLRVVEEGVLVLGEPPGSRSCREEMEKKVGHHEIITQQKGGGGEEGTFLEERGDGLRASSPPLDDIIKRDPPTHRATHRHHDIPNKPHRPVWQSGARPTSRLAVPPAALLPPVGQQPSPTTTIKEAEKEKEKEAEKEEKQQQQDLHEQQHRGRHSLGVHTSTASSHPHTAPTSRIATMPPNPDDKVRTAQKLQRMPGNSYTPESTPPTTPSSPPPPPPHPFPPHPFPPNPFGRRIESVRSDPTKTDANQGNGDNPVATVAETPPVPNGSPPVPPGGRRTRGAPRPVLPYTPATMEVFTCVIWILLLVGITACACVFPYQGLREMDGDRHRWEVTLASWSASRGFPSYGKDDTHTTAHSAHTTQYKVYVLSADRYTPVRSGT